MKILSLLAASLAALALVPATAAAPELPDNMQCMWEPGFAQFVYDATLGVVHLHDGTICTAHVHQPQPGGPEYCMWEPGFAQFVYDLTLGLVHLHDGRICYAHLHI